MRDGVNERGQVLEFISSAWYCIGPTMGTSTVIYYLFGGYVEEMKKKKKKTKRTRGDTEKRAKKKEWETQLKLLMKSIIYDIPWNFDSKSKKISTEKSPRASQMVRPYQHQCGPRSIERRVDTENEMNNKNPDYTYTALYCITDYYK